MLWTRAVPDRGSSVQVGWEIAQDADFSNVIHSGSAEALEAHDFTIKVDVRGLNAGETYFYRFHSRNNASPAGVTRTLADGAVDQVKLAVVSCSNYPAGYFHAYREVAALEDLDAVVHLGDYIYEYSSESSSYAAADAEELGRTFPDDNNRELITLADYRRRYGIYRSDTDLQQLHQKVPFIVVWDDHEVANDTWQDGAENHNPDQGDGDFTERKMAALRAFFEWMPIRPVIEGSHETIYRSFRFGDLVDLHMLDTRIIGRDQQLDYLNYFGNGGLNVAQFTTDVLDENRTLLGAEQRLWLQAALGGSSATWQVLGQQVLMGRMNLPAELLMAIATQELDNLPESLIELARIKGQLLLEDPSVTEEERARIELSVPYNLDAWDGYQFEREVLLNTAKQLNKNLVVLAGDTHNAWASNLKDKDGHQIGVEFATASVTSPGLEGYLGLPPEMIPGAEQGIGVLVDDLEYLNISQRGYMLVTFTPDEARADWRFVNTVKNRQYAMDAQAATSLRVLPGDGNRRLESVAD